MAPRKTNNALPEARAAAVEKKEAEAIEAERKTAEEYAVSMKEKNEKREKQIAEEKAKKQEEKKEQEKAKKPIFIVNVKHNGKRYAVGDDCPKELVAQFIKSGLVDNR